MSTHVLFLVRMDVAHDHEAAFNEVYDTEHVPNLRAVPGVRRAARYRQPSPVYSRYLAAYELDGPAVLDSAAWKAAKSFRFYQIISPGVGRSGTCCPIRRRLL